jgi:hypothetical protein
MNRHTGSILAGLMAAAVMIAGTIWAKRSGVASDAMLICVDSVAGAAFLVFQRVLTGRG